MALTTGGETGRPFHVMGIHARDTRVTGRAGKEAEVNCSICGEPIEGHGHNAEPVKDGRACDTCNELKVIPARIKAKREQCTCDIRRKFEWSDNNPNCPVHSS